MSSVMRLAMPTMVSTQTPTGPEDPAWAAQTDCPWPSRPMIHFLLAVGVPCVLPVAHGRRSVSQQLYLSTSWAPPPHVKNE